MAGSQHAMRTRILTVIAAAALLGVAGCGSDDDDDKAATVTTPAAGTATATDPAPTTATQTGSSGDALSPEGRAVLDASQDLAADVSQTVEDFARGRIEQDEAIARLELAGERAGDLRRRAQDLPATDRAGERLAAFNDEIGRASADLSRDVSAGRAARQDEIDERLAQLRREARSTVETLSAQLDERARKRFRDALDSIGVDAPG